MGELTKKVGELFSNLTGPLSNEIGEMLRDELRPYRAARQTRLAEKTARKLQEAEIKPVAVPPKILLSIFENAGFKDDEDMHDRWATLLANAATPGLGFVISIVFVEILKQMSPKEARYLDSLVVEFEAAKKRPPEPAWRKAPTVPEEFNIGNDSHMLSLYGKAGFTRVSPDTYWHDREKPGVQEDYNEDVSEFNVVLNNLQRLGVIQRRARVEKSPASQRGVISNLSKTRTSISLRSDINWS